jgi:polar amino acid transport system substrate-binding protein
MMTNLRELFAVVLTLLLVSGCNTVQPRSDDQSVLARIEQRGELVLGTSGDMEPMSYTREDGTLVGLDIDIGRFMAQAMGVKLTTRTLPFTDLLPALQRGEVDVAISNLTITPKRNMSVAFVGPYMTSGKCILTRQESLARAQQAEDLNTPDTRIAVMKGSTSEDFVKTLLPQATVMLTDSRAAAVDLVKSDQAGGMLTDYPICMSTVKNHPEAGFVSLFSLLSYEPIGIALPGNDPLFVNWTENFLMRMEALGALDEIGKRWFGEYAKTMQPE